MEPAADSMGEIVIEGKTIRFAGFHTSADARTYRDQFESKYYALVLGDFDNPLGRFWVCTLGDAVRLEGAGYCLIG